MITSLYFFKQQSLHKSLPLACSMSFICCTWSSLWLEFSSHNLVDIHFFWSIYVFNGVMEVQSELCKDIRACPPLPALWHTVLEGKSWGKLGRRPKLPSYHCSTVMADYLLTRLLFGSCLVRDIASQTQYTSKSKHLSSLLSLLSQ